MIQMHTLLMTIMMKMTMVTRKQKMFQAWIVNVMLNVNVISTFAQKGYTRARLIMKLEHDIRENENDGKFKDVRQACNVCNKAIA